ncbi:Uncharacterised protein [Alysiella crassa]|uniref:Uncharacterized protein n=1 Tax=Alysiella crassa TaxID=153491 RepID=A0A376BNL5_9NEIS|nr:Uncharacterised protein [Alysiella crassa]
MIAAFVVLTERLLFLTELIFYGRDYPFVYPFSVSHTRFF